MIYLTGDTHGYWDKREQFLQSLTKEDIVICLGDLGWSWDINHINGFCPNATWLSVLGNHENYDLIEKMPVIELYGGKVRKMKEGVYYLLNGEMYTIEDKKYFVFGGALSIDKRYRLPRLSWWPEEIPTKNDYDNAIDNLKKNNWTFDYFLTHTVEDEKAETVLGHDAIPDSTGRMLSALKHEIKEHGGSFKTHFFGHLHAFWKGVTEDYEWYCLYEQIMDLYSNKIYFY